MKKKTHEQFLKEVYELVKDEYTVLTEYINCHTKIKIKHNKCNHIYEVKPNDFQQGHRCPHCKNNNKRKSHEHFLKEVYELVKDEYTVINSYINCRTKIKIKHNKCNHIYTVLPTDFLQGYRCPYCNSSKGEKRIEKWLIENNLDFKTQYKFKDCKYKRQLPFDFKLEDTSGKIILIEYDGIQHFKECWYNDLEKIKIRDNIKNQYCKLHNIDLYRISYKDYDNIESILENIIKNYP